MSVRDHITFGGKPVTLGGKEVRVGDIAPNFSAINKDMSAFNLNDYEGKIRIISVVPSVDTKICEFQTIRFNEEATEHPNVVVITISVDLPFAQQRFCVANDIENAMVISDYRDLEFGALYGFVMKEHRLLARGIVVIDEENIVRYVEYVENVNEHPNYDKVIDFLEDLEG